MMRMTRTLALATAAIVFAAAFLAGCGTVRLEAGNAQVPVSTLESTLRPGVSTQRDVLRVFGQPYGRGGAQLPFHPTPRTTWTYFREEGTVELPIGAHDERVFLFIFFEGDKFDSYMWFRSRAEPVK